MTSHTTTCTELEYNFFLYLEDNQIAELEGKSEEIFSEGLAELSEGQEVTTHNMRETEMWSKYIAWCEERYSDRNVSETLRKKVNSVSLFLSLYLPLSL